MHSFKEFLSEGFLGYSDAIKHGFKYLELFISKIETGSEFKVKGGTAVIDNDDNVKKLKMMMTTADDNIIPFLKTITFKSVDGKSYKWSQFDKTEFSGIKSSMNKGDLTEGIVAAAITAKFINPNKTIGEKDIQNILKQLDSSGGKKQTFIHKSKTSGTDKVTLVIELKPNSAAALMNDKNWAELRDEFKGAAKYANSPYVARYAELLDQNNTDDHAIISSEGAVDEKLTKVDLSVMIGLDGETPVLTDLNLSLKAGATKNLEQAGITYEKVVASFAKFGIDISGFNVDFKKEEKWYEDAFAYAALYLNKQLRNPKNTYNLLKKIADGVRQAATKGDSSVVQVKIIGGSFKMYTYDKIEDKLKDFNLRAYHEVNKARPFFGIFDTKTKKDLITFRLEVRGGDRIYKMHVEKGPILDDIASV